MFQFSAKAQKKHFVKQSSAIISALQVGKLRQSTTNSPSTEQLPAPTVFTPLPPHHIIAPMKMTSSNTTITFPPALHLLSTTWSLAPGVQSWAHSTKSSKALKQKHFADAKDLSKRERMKIEAWASSEKWLFHQSKAAAE